MFKINKIEDSVIENKITNLILSHRKDLTVEQAEQIAEWAKDNPVQVVFGTTDEIMKSFNRCVKECLN